MKKIIGFFICILLCTVMLTAVGEYIETIDIQGGDDFSTRVNIPVDYYAKYLRVDIDTSLLSSKGPHQLFESIAPADGVYVVSYKTASNKNTMNTLLIGVQTTSSKGWVKTSDGNDGHVIENAKHSIRVAAKKDDALTIDIYASVIIPEKVEMTICFDGYHVPRSANYILKQADCVNEGTRVVSDCMLCGSAVETTGIPALGHDISAEPTVVKQANCTEKGLEAHFCSRCNGMFNMAEIPELGHSFTEELMVIKAATCTEPGIRGHVCNRCGISEDQEEIPARGHIEGREEVVQEATCLEDGLINVYCDRCGELFSNKEIPALGHTEGTEKVVRTASCLQEGLIHVIISQEDINSRICCKLDSHGTLSFPDSTQTIETESLRGSAANHVLLPESCTQIGANAFADMDLWSITIPGEHTVIDESAFGEIPNLTILAVEGSDAAVFAENHGYMLKLMDGTN